MTQGRRQILQAIRDRWAKHGFAPTVREIAGDLNVPVTRVWRMLAELRAAGLVEYQDRARRTLKVKETIGR